MKIKFFIFIVVCVSVFSLMDCKNKENTPENLINQDEMAHFIAELQLLESRVSRSSFNGQDSARVAYLYLAEELLNEKGFDTISYRESYTYYSDDPELFEQIYEKSIKILESKKDERKPGDNTDIQ